MSNRKHTSRDEKLLFTVDWIKVTRNAARVMADQ